MTRRRQKRTRAHKNDRQRTKAAALSPQAPLPAPGGSSHQGVRTLTIQQAGVRVTEATALTLGAVWACRRAIGEDLAKLPWQVFRRTAKGRAAEPSHPVEWLLHTQSNPEMSAFDWRDTILGHALLWGNSFSEIERDYAGRPHWLWPVTPDRTELCRTASGKLVVDVANPREPNTVLDYEDVYHLKGPSFDGLVGYSMVRFASRCIGLGISLEEAAANFTGNDSTPGGLITVPGVLTDNAHKNLRESWGKRHQGPYKRRTVGILENGAGWTQTGLPPEDSQLIEQRQATPAEICRWFRCPPHVIQDLLRATFSNIESQAISYVGDALLPWARRLESEADLKLFGPINRGQVFTRHDFHSMLRGDQAARTAYYQPLLDRGVFCINDVREKEGMNGIGPDGDKRFVALNMQLLEDAGEEPPAPAPVAPKPAPPAPGEPPAASGDKPPAAKPAAKASRLGSDDQPRADDGKWTDGEGAAGEHPDDKEDREIDAAREKEDEAVSDAREKEDDRTERQRSRAAEKEDGKAEREQERADAKEDAKIDRERDRAAAGKSEEERSAQDKKWDKEDAARDVQRNARDDKGQKERDGTRQGKWDKEDKETGKARDKEDADRQAARDKEDKEIQDRRDAGGKPAAKMGRPSALLPVLEDACARILHREELRVADANKRLAGDAAKLAGWRADFRVGQLAFAADALTAGLQAVAGVAGPGADAGQVVGVVLPLFVASYDADLAGRWDAGRHHHLLPRRYAGRLLAAAQAACAAATSFTQGDVLCRP